ncbi:hypothetical protein OIV83_003355 [Microbotryomycetes sp. JL201]|nr:hypothetical protein OIV83_003355 [Microbotryomycetes sp. JL201]
MTSKSNLKHMHERLASRLQQFFGENRTDGYIPVGNTSEEAEQQRRSYGATSGSTSNTDGLQKLGADPSKIEPKVWLASERTFLNWLRVSFLLSSFALALFNSARPQDKVAKWMGFVYAVIAVFIIAYAYVMQQVRRHRIIHRYPGHHDEPYGPVVIVGLIFLAVLVNFILRVNQRERLRDHPTPKNPWIQSVELIKSVFITQRDVTQFEA